MSIEIYDFVRVLNKFHPFFSTNRFRQWFVYFDKNKDGTATKEEVLSGLEEVIMEITETCLCIPFCDT